MSCASENEPFCACQNSCLNVAFVTAINLGLNNLLWVKCAFRGIQALVLLTIKSKLPEQLMENMYYLPNQVPFEKQAGLKKGRNKDSI